MSQKPSEKRSGSSWFADLPMQWKAGLIVATLIGMVVLLLAVNSLVTMAGDENRRRADHLTHTIVQSNAVARAIARRQAELVRASLIDPAGLAPRLAVGNEAVMRSLGGLNVAVAAEPALRPAVERANRIESRWGEVVAAPLLDAASAGDAAGMERALKAYITAEAGGEGGRGIVNALDDLTSAAQAELASARLELDRNEATVWIIDIVALVATIAAGLAGIILGARFVTGPLRHLAMLMEQLANHDHSIEVLYRERRDEVGTIARALSVFKAMAIEGHDNAWVKTSVGEISARLQACTDLRGFADTLLRELSPRVEAGVGVFYDFDEAAGTLALTGSYAFTERRHLSTTYRLGEGLVGQCALEKKPITLSPVPDDYVRIHSGTGEAAPRAVVALPVTTKDGLRAVIELASFQPMTGPRARLLAEVLPLVALSLDNLTRAIRTHELLERSQTQATELRVAEEELRIQQEELRATNEQLHAQQQKLAASEEELRVQADDLQTSNDVLRRSSDELTAQKAQLVTLNEQMQARAEELTRANQYKSQFLANMSHELRTPLNSLLILSHDLSENRSGNLDADQVEASSIIHQSGSNLLRLINDILDLSKVEAGKMEVAREPVSIAAFSQRLERNFRRLAQERKLRFTVTTTDAPEHVYTDAGKLEQILTNLIGNALKFTVQGRVSVIFSKGEADDTLKVAVTDSGIGIPDDKREAIFEAFEQVDSSTRRQFGGTGLGLAITQRLANLLGGEVTVDSKVGQGSTFTLTIPVGEPPLLEDDALDTDVPGVQVPGIQVPGVQVPGAANARSYGPVAGLRPPSAPAAAERAAAGLPPLPAPAVPDDRDALAPGATAILVVEDDPVFARTLVGLVRRKGYKVLAAGDGESGLELARRYRPTGILLDVMLPGMDGWTVIEQLKADPATRHIPVHFVSALDEGRRGRDLGAVGFLTKPVSADQLGEALSLLAHFSEDRPRRVLVVDDDAAARHAVRTLLAREKAEILEAASGEEALEVVAQTPLDCMVLDLGLPGMSGFDLIERLAEGGHPVPVVVYSGRDLTTEERLRLRAFTDSIVVKGALSPERLLDEVSLFLHSVQHEPKALPEHPDGDLAERKLLLVDDDMRNIYALAKVLRARGINVVLAQDGVKALAQLDEQPDIEIVLMDVMMPVMDGYEAMAEIRKQPRFGKLPVIALTAKAMKDDREKCLAAGASDYLAKPVDVPKLLSMIRAWLPPR